MPSCYKQYLTPFTQTGKAGICLERVWHSLIPPLDVLEREPLKSSADQSQENPDDTHSDQILFISQGSSFCMPLYMLDPQRKMAVEYF